jgi:hypothetical protein
LLSFPGIASSSYSYNWVVGKPITIAHVYRFNGVNDSAGIYQFLDSKGDNAFYPTNTVAIDRAAVFYGGLENSVSYKGFQIDFLFQFVKQTGQNVFAYANNPPGFMYNQPTAVLNRWQKPGDMKPYEQFTESYSSNSYGQYAYYYQESTAAYTDASFIRLKNLSISYSMPKSIVGKMHLRDFRIYIHGQNLLTITKYMGFDPETQAVSLPPLRVWTAGIQLGL